MLCIYTILILYTRCDASAALNGRRIGTHENIPQPRSLHSLLTTDLLTAAAVAGLADNRQQPTDRLAQIQ